MCGQPVELDRPQQLRQRHTGGHRRCKDPGADSFDGELGAMRTAWSVAVVQVQKHWSIHRRERGPSTDHDRRGLSRTHRQRGDCTLLQLPSQLGKPGEGVT